MTEGGARVVEIYTDGACSGNPGPGGWGAVLRYGDTEKEIYGGDPATTNNRMELTAVIRGLEALKRPSTVTVYSDSKYVVQGASNSLSIWRVNGWQTRNKRSVKNIDLWERLDELAQEHSVTWEWVRGHNGHPDNERADRLAVRGAREASTGAAATAVSPRPTIGYHPADLFSVGPEPRSVQPTCAELPGERRCRHELPIGQCDYCKAPPRGVLARGYRTRGGRAFHNDASCQWLLEGQRQSYRQGLRIHEIVAVSWHSVDPTELQPCEWCCTQQWLDRHRG